MPVGLITNSGGGLSRVITASTSNVDLFALFDSPASAVAYTVIIPSGVTVGSSSTSGVSIDATGFNSSSSGIWSVAGDIIGAGGDGGDGGGLHGGGVFAGGGGGGGAGVTKVGVGGSGHLTASDGSDGTATTGGAGGASIVDTDSESTLAATEGVVGGDAIHINHPITVVLLGTIGSGGGGGGGTSEPSDVSPGGAGGDIGDAGDAGGIFFPIAGGDAGFAIRYSESGDATVNLIDSGEVKGTVG